MESPFILKSPTEQLVPIDDKPFAGIAEWEQQNVLATANHVFFGLHMSQHPQAVVKLNQLLNAIQPRNIIEIGSGNCGLSFLFALYAINTGGHFVTFDITRGKHVDLLIKSFGAVVFQQGDILTEQGNIKAMRQRLRELEGRTLLVCDCGKALEYNLYVPSLKIGDFVITHDFAPDATSFERDIKGRGVWNWFENWYERIERVTLEQGIIHTTVLNDVVWSVGWKTK